MNKHYVWTRLRPRRVAWYGRAARNAWSDETEAQGAWIALLVLCIVMFGAFQAFGGL